MPDHYNPDEVRTCEQIQDIIRSSFFPGFKQTFMSTLKKAWARFKCVSIALGHAWVNLWVDPLQTTKLGEDKGRRLGKALSWIVPILITIGVIAFIRRFA